MINPENRCTDTGLELTLRCLSPMADDVTFGVITLFEILSEHRRHHTKLPSCFEIESVFMEK